MQDYISEKPGFPAGLRKEIFCAGKRRIRRVDEFSLKISTAVEIAPRASDRRTAECLLAATAAAAAAREM